MALGPPPLALETRTPGSARLWASAARLNSNPEPIHQPFDLRIVGIDDVKPAHQGLVRIDGFILEDGSINEFLAGKIAVGIRHEIGVRSRYIGLLQIIDERMRLVRVRRVAGD